MSDMSSSIQHSRVGETSGLRAMIDATSVAAFLSGLISVAVIITVLSGEAIHGGDYLLSSTARFAGISALAAAALLVVGILGVAIRFASVLSPTGRVAIIAVTLAAALTVAVEGTYGLILIDVMARIPEIAETPPAALEVAFPAARFTLGLAGILLAWSLRRSRFAPTASWVFLLIASVVALVPMPSSYLLFAFAVGAVLRASRKRFDGRFGTDVDATEPGTHRLHVTSD